MEETETGQDSAALPDAFALHNAARSGDEAEVSSLLLLPDVTDRLRKRDSHERTPLHLACFANKRAVVEQLVTAGASVNATAKAGFSCLHFAAQAGATDAAEALLLAGAKPSVWEARKKATPMHLAAQKGHAGLVTLLLRHGADPLAKTKQDQTPFDLGRAHEAVAQALSAHLAELQSQAQAAQAQAAQQSASGSELKDPVTAKKSAPSAEGAELIHPPATQPSHTAEDGPVEEGDGTNCPAEEAEEDEQPKKKRKKKKQKGTLSLSHLEDGDIPF